jgi:CheY-like chemotaxis protein
MFSQAGRPASRTHEGLGIGLWLVRKLVEMHGGSVEATSAGVGKGSEFVVRLPIAAEQRSSESGPEAAVSEERLSGLLVLVVDDNRDAADSLGALLRSLGGEVRVAYDGPSALEMLADFRPDVALMDIGMPRMDGYELARQVRERPDYRDIVLIALTGWGKEEDRRRAQEAGFAYHLGKPAGVAELRSLILATRRTAPDLTPPTSRARASA